ncbi:MAG: DNA-binding protein [Burkholderiaceae bacterium]|nr:DNA-binding protein [Burkholderiaceae bacterium]TXH40012.1 MAG: DNA-binding protein [Burkholderiaceae bacterium]
MNPTLGTLDHITCAAGPLGFVVGEAAPEPAINSTPDQIKQRFRQRGQTFSQWARDNNYPVNKVLRVLNGFEKGHYGKAHEIAVKLGLKPSSDAPLQ